MRLWLIRASVILNVVCVAATAAYLVRRLRAHDEIPSSAWYGADRRELLSGLPVLDGAVVVAGDSHVDRGEWVELLGKPGVLNRGIAGDTVRHLLVRVDDLVRGGPRRLVVMVGTNDLIAGRAPSEITADYRLLLLAVRALSPSTRVSMMSVPPINDRLTTEPIDNVAVRALNRALVTLADEHRCDFIDLASLLADSEGRLDARFTNDGVHLRPEGYRLWSELLASVPE